MMSYSKKGGFREPNEPINYEITTEHTNNIDFVVPSINYSKQDGIKDPLTFLIIISGGEKREKQYFNLIEKNNFNKIKLEFIADPKRLNPQGMLDVANEVKLRYLDNEAKEFPDDYYLVSDVDHFYNDLLKILPKCKEQKLHLIISNPCIEIWLYYGEFSVLPSDFNIPKLEKNISGQFKRYLDQKINGGVDPRKAIFNIETAKHNSKNNYKVDDKEIPKLFSTSMWQLAEKIIPLIIDKLDELKRNMEKRN